MHVRKPVILCAKTLFPIILHKNTFAYTHVTFSSKTFSAVLSMKLSR